MLCANKLSKHATGQLEAREDRHAIPACRLANRRPGNLDTLSQHAVETNHRLGKLDMLSQHTLQKLPIKEAAKAQNSGQVDTAK